MLLAVVVLLSGCGSSDTAATETEPRPAESGPGESIEDADSDVLGSSIELPPDGAAAGQAAGPDGLVTEDTVPQGQADAIPADFDVLLSSEEFAGLGIAASSESVRPEPPGVCGRVEPWAERHLKTTGASHYRGVAEQEGEDLLLILQVVWEFADVASSGSAMATVVDLAKSCGANAGATAVQFDVSADEQTVIASGVANGLKQFVGFSRAGARVTSLVIVNEADLPLAASEILDRARAKMNSVE